MVLGEGRYKLNTVYAGIVRQIGQPPAVQFGSCADRRRVVQAAEQFGLLGYPTAAPRSASRRNLDRAGVLPDHQRAARVVLARRGDPGFRAGQFEN